MKHFISRITSAASDSSKRNWEWQQEIAVYIVKWTLTFLKKRNTESFARALSGCALCCHVPICLNDWLVGRHFSVLHVVVVRIWEMIERVETGRISTFESLKFITTCHRSRTLPKVVYKSVFVSQRLSS